MARPVEKPSSSWAMRSSKLGDVLSVTIAVCKLDVFLAKIELQLHQGSVFDQGFPKGIDLVAKAPSKLLHRQLVSAGVLGIDEVAYGLSLGEVALAVQERRAG